MLTGKSLILVFLFTITLKNGHGSINEAIKNATNQFSLDLLKVALQDPGNVIVSPVSVSTLLAILQQGARGISKEEVNNVVHALPEATKEAYSNITARYKENYPRTVLDFSTRAFAAESFQLKPEFKQVLINDFHSDIDSVNFTNPVNASDTINSWVSQHTHQRISQLFQPTDISPSTSLILVNAIYFKSFWDNAFHSAFNKPFSPSNGVEVHVPTLNHTHIYHAGQCSCIGVKYVHLEFAGTNQFTVMLMLPTERHGLQQLVESMTAENLTNFISHQGLKRVTLQFPKFRLTTESQLKPMLQKLGVHQVFEDNADLSGITDQGIKVSKVIQKAEIQADEGGVTASAATGFTFTYMSARVYPTVDDMEFIADHPFLFFIVDRTYHVPLFAGRVTNPSV